MRDASLSAGLLAFLALVAQTVDAQVPVPVGGEFRVNAVTAGHQDYSNVGIDADGDFVVVWKSFDGNLFGVFARRFDSAGVAQGGQFQVNTYTTNDQTVPVIDVDGDGDFVIAWTSTGQDGDQEGIFARRFSSAGAALTAEFMVNTTTANIQSTRSVANESNGDFVVVWQASFQDGSSFGIFARRFNSAGTPLGAELPVNTFTMSSQSAAYVDMDADGDFVVTWASAGQDGHLSGVFGKRYSSAGAPLGPEFQINTTFTQQQFAPNVGVDADGDFVVVWLSPDGGDYGLFGQRFSSSGTPQGTEFPVNSYTPTNQLVPVIAIDADGDFVVAWTDSGLDGSGNGIFARRFKSSGVPQNLDTRVNTTTAGDQPGPGVAATPDGDFVVSWTSADGSYIGIWAQRFDVPPLLDVDGDGQVLPLTDGLLVLRFSFGFTGVTLITGAVGPGCTRCDAPSITAYLQSLL